MAGWAGAIRAGLAFVELSVNDKVSKEIDKISKKIRDFANKAADLAKIPIVASVGSAIPLGWSAKTFMEFDDKMRLAAAVSGIAGKQFELLTEKAKYLGRTTSWTASEVADSFVNLGRMGFDYGEMNASVAAVMNLARATGTTLPTASELAGVSLRQFEYDASQMSRVVDVMTAATNGSAQRLEDLGESMKYAAPIAHSAKMEIEDTAIVLASLADFGIKGSQAGVTLRRVLIQLSNVKVQKALFDVFGVSAVDSTGNIRNVADVITELGESTKALPTADKITVLQDLFGVYALAGASSLTNVDFKGYADSIRNAGNIAENTAKQMDAGLGGAFRLGKSAIEGVSLAIGEELSPKLIEMSQTIQDNTPAIVEWIKQHKGVGKQYIETAIKVSAYSAAVFALAKIISTATKAFDLIHVATVGYTKILDVLIGVTRTMKAAEAATMAVETARNEVTRTQQMILAATTPAEYAAAVAANAKATADLAAAQAAEKAALATAAFRNSLMGLTMVITIVLAAAAALYYLGGAAERASEKAQKNIDKIKEQTRAREEQFASADQLMTRLQELDSIQNKNNEQMAEANQIINSLSAQYGNLGLSIDQTTGKINGLIEAQSALARQKLEAEIASKTAIKNANETKLNALQKEGSKLGGNANVLTGAAMGLKYGVGSWFGGKSFEDRMAEIGAEKQTLGTENKVLEAEIKGMKARLEAMNKDEAERLNQTHQSKNAPSPPFTPPELSDNPVSDVENILSKEGTRDNKESRLEGYSRKWSDQFNPAKQQLDAAQINLRKAQNLGTPEQVKQAQKIFDSAKINYDAALKKGVPQEVIDAAKKEMDDAQANYNKEMNLGNNASRRKAKERLDSAKSKYEELNKYGGGSTYYEAQRGVAQAQLDYQKALQSGDTKKIKETFAALEDANKKFDDVKINATSDWAADALRKYDEAVKGGNQEQIDSAYAELNDANSELANLLNAAEEGKGDFETVASSTGTFDAFSAMDMSFDWQKKEMKDQTNLLTRVAGSLDKIEKRNADEDML